MKRFDLEAAKAGAPLITRDGRSARFIAVVPEANRENVLLVFIYGNDSVSEFNLAGEIYSFKHACEDLFMAPVKVTRWVNLYNNKSYDDYESADRAHQNASIGAIAIAVPVEIEQ